MSMRIAVSRASVNQLAASARGATRFFSGRKDSIQVSTFFVQISFLRSSDSHSRILDLGVTGERMRSRGSQQRIFAVLVLLVASFDVSRDGEGEGIDERRKHEADKKAEQDTEATRKLNLAFTISSDSSLLSHFYAWSGL
ncbi:hypothetical protein NL676_004947 [Syzygium grande]|nr:hypothetical protein NL676_004947 [Syzygium grande]